MIFWLTVFRRSESFNFSFFSSKFFSKSSTVKMKRLFQKKIFRNIKYNISSFIIISKLILSVFLNSQKVVIIVTLMPQHIRLILSESLFFPT